MTSKSQGGLDIWERFTSRQDAIRLERQFLWVHVDWGRSATALLASARRFLITFGTCHGWLRHFRTAIQIPFVS